MNSDHANAAFTPHNIIFTPPLFRNTAFFKKTAMFAFNFCESENKMATNTFKKIKRILNESLNLEYEQNQMKQR